MSIFSFPQKSPLAPHLQVGRDGESVAVKYLRHLGYKIIDCNIRMGKDEIDILALDPEDDVFVFAEVKSRAQAGEYDPEINITPKKRYAMMRAARHWMEKSGSERGYRLDVICIAEGRVVDHFIEIGADD